MSNDIDIPTVNIMVDSTLEKLENFKKNNGKELVKVYDIISDSVSHDVKLCDKQQAHIQFQNAGNAYLDELIKNLNLRFEKESMKTLQLSNTVLNPALVPRNTGLENHECDELQQLVEQ